VVKRLVMLSIVSALLSSVFQGSAAGDPIGVEISNVRHAYYRSETVTFEVKVTNGASASAEDISATIELAPLAPVEKALRLKGGETATVSYEVRCAELRPGGYDLRAVVEYGGGKAEKSFEVFISESPNPQRLPVYYWGDSADMMDWGIEHGFNTFAIPNLRIPFEENGAGVRERRELFDKAVRKRVNLGIYLYTVDKRLFEDHPEVFVVPREAGKGEVLDNQRPNQLCLREPYVIEYAEKTARANMKLFGIYPSFYHSLINSEFRSPPCYSDHCRGIMEHETGLDLYDYDVDPLHPPKTEEEARKPGLPEKLVKAVPKGGIIEDDNPYYRYYMWWWKRGMGDVLLNERMSDIIKEYKPDVITWHDPYRLAPVYGRHRGLDCIGQWTYTHPDPKYTAYIETLITGAAPEKQMVMPDMTTWEYQNWLAPTDSGVVIIPEHILRENCWIALSRRPDIICHYISSSFNPRKEKDPWHRDPKTFEMMMWMSENVYRPYGAFILQMKRTPRKAAILCSAASVLFPEINRGGWPNKAIYPFYSLLMMAHIPTDVIFDETVTRYGLYRYDILFLHQCETLTRSVYEEILEFKKRGGIVIGDELLRADIPLDYRCEFDLEHRKRQLADLVLKGEGVTADEDREIMNRYAGELRRVLDGKVDRFVDSESTEVVFNVLENGPVKYVFMVNDKRTYGDRFGKWKTFHEKGVEQTVNARIFAEGKTPVLYDVRRHSRLPVERRGDEVRFAVTLGPCDGTIVAVYPRALERISIDCPEIVERGASAAVKISVIDSAGESCGTQPVKIRVIDASGAETDYSDYYATNGGEFSLDITPALNDAKGTWKVEVTELTSGIDASASFVVR